MNLSCRWLSELVDLEGAGPEEIARLLTFHVAEVEDTETRGEGLEGVVTARVTGVRAHPDADRLRLCTVDDGSGEEHEVVCGAPNVAEGQMICYAGEGLTLPNGLTLERRKIRGVFSAGMICAEDELGLGEDHDGILVLPDDTPIGVPVSEALGVADVILDVNNTSITHRPDLWGHVGFARELSALREVPFEAPGSPAADAALESADGEPFPIDIEDAEGCRRYVGVVLEGVRIGPSPEPLRRRLEALGVRSIDLLVDLTNLVMLEQGQPLHAFDLDTLRGERIVVRAARPGETIKTLDEIERVLEPTDIVIADAERAVAIAGVMGGLDTEVRPESARILLEAATFDPVRVRRTAARLNLRTEASARFEKTLDPVTALTAARRFVELLLAYQPDVRVTRPLGDAYPRPHDPVRIHLPYSFVQRRLGMRVPESIVRRRLHALGFRVDDADDDGMWVDVPSWRATKDVGLPEDLVEEVGRLVGYDGLAEMPPVGTLTPTRPPPIRMIERRLGSTLSLDLGYAETKAYCFCGPKDCARLGLEDTKHLEFASAYSEEQDRLILTVAPNLLRVVRRNIAREAEGRIWESTRLVAPGIRDDAGLPREIRVLGLVAWDRGADEDPDGVLFRGLVQDARQALGAVPVAGASIREAGSEALAAGLPEPTWLHPGRRAAIVEGDRVLGIVGEVAPSVLRSYRLEGRVVLGEISLDAVLDARGDEGAVYRPIHRFPVVPFDVAVVVPRRTPAAQVAATIASVSETAVRDIEVFDAYEGPGIPEGHRSLAYRMSLIDPDGTLTSRKADALRTGIRRALEAEGWSVRAGDGEES